MRRRAVVFLTGFGVLGRNHDYITDTRRRGLVPLLVTPESFRESVAAARAHPGHVVHRIEEIRFVTGRLDSPESFTGEVAAVVSAWERDYEFVGVCAVGEVLVEQAGLVADRYGLPGPGLRASRVCRSKVLQRWYLPQYAPGHQVVPPGARAVARLDGLRYPVVVKPVSRHSSSGVVEVADPAACRELLAGYPAHETLLVEERVSGPEFSVEALVQNGEVVFASATAKRTTESTGGGFTELGHSLPYHGEHEKVLISATHDLLQALDFRDGMAHAEWRVAHDDGRPVLMEVAARTPGDALLLLYRLATGRSMEEAVLRISLGEPADYPLPRRSARQVYVEHPAGAVLRDVTYDGPADEPVRQPVWLADAGGQWPQLPAASGLRAVFVLVGRGTTLRAIGSSDDRAVTFVVDGADEAELDAHEAAVTAGLHVGYQPAGSPEAVGAP
ncbi:ATP-grasp domain-containing protein [Kineosporia sp. J2-2]|uniref:ATP-grasp domain-containing protein n=1 Tax=Kineosporia corallincola TaxID=2835133 RepID=A0ABS5TB50_9ACTN|nr:ATP-grasp domain-containing protein [Kineosporia corallincola]MBT0768286.1 ATP-grasp domain-containing protein [Kineosporia corallincola]